jgi:predicted nicotinamide N-methyase
LNDGQGAWSGGERGGVMRGMEVVELGAGPGLPGLVCASMGATVVLTDDLNPTPCTLNRGWSVCP